MKLRKIISGGQTGADEAGLDAGRELGLETGGTAPYDWRTEEGPQEEKLRAFGLEPGPFDPRGYPLRTKKNVKDSDATVVFGNTEKTGSSLTIRLARSAKKPVLTNPTVLELRTFLDVTEIEVLNVAGNRASVNPSVYLLTYSTLIEAVRGGSKSLIAGARHGRFELSEAREQLA